MVQILERMKLLENGNLGIGTTSPTEKLHINGGNITITEGSSNNNGSIKIIPSAPISMEIVVEEYFFKNLATMDSHWDTMGVIIIVF